MSARAEKKEEHTNRSVTSDSYRDKGNSEPAFQLVDNRVETKQLVCLQELADNHSQSIQMQGPADSYFSSQKAPIQKKEEGRVPIQRLKKHFPTKDNDDPLVVTHKNAVEQVVGQVENRVDQARGLALNWHQLDFENQGYLGLWARTARDYFNNPKEVPDFIHARFGYAIETLACGNLPDQHAGLSIDFQVSVGSTRPDIVLSHPGDGVVGWLDITSLDSVNHILGKDGAGWRTKPFVYEIFYQPLSLPDILTGLEDPVYKAWGEYLSIKNQIAHEEKEKKRTELRNSLLKLQEDNSWQTGIGNAATKRSLTKGLLEELGMELGNSSQQATRGALAVTEINDGAYGYNRGSIATDTTKAKRFISDQAASEISERHTSVEQSYLEHYQDIIANHQDLPLVGALYEYLSGENDDKIEIGTAVAASVQEYESLEEARTELSDSHDERATTLDGMMSEWLGQLPEAISFDALREWSNRAVALRKKLDILKQVIAEQQNFLGYLQMKYGEKSFFSRTPQEHQLVQALSQMPETLEIVLAARQYRESNPI